jgi:superfamily I DNA/RNA helicase
MSTVLTPEQAEAAKPHVGRKAVVATAGGGKTTTSAKSIAIKLYGDDVTPEDDRSIMATTFTRASAGDLRGKINAMAGRPTQVDVGTLHSFCFDLLIRHATRIGFPAGVQMIKESEKRARMQSILHGTLVSRGMSPDKYPLADFFLAGNRSDILAVSSNPLDLGRLAGWRCPQVLTEAYEAYKRYQRAGGFVDFDTMLVYAYEILKSIPSRDDAEKEGIILPKHVYVDEAQDLSAIQWSIVDELARLAVSLTVIGDDDQAIYGWRGATVWRFKKFYQEAEHKCLLTSNRRCPSNIVSVAEGIVARIPIERRIPKSLKSGKSVQNGTVMVCSGVDRQSVLEKIMSFIRDSVATGKIRYKDFAVIYRNTTYVVDEYAQAMTNAGIPYRTLGGKDPMDTDEMRLLRYTLALASSGTWNSGEESRGNWLGLLESVGVSHQAAEAIITKASSSGGLSDHYLDAISQSRIASDSKFSLLSIGNALQTCRTARRRVKVGDVAGLDVIMKSIEGTIAKTAERYVKSFLRSGKITAGESETIREDYIASRKEAASRFIDQASSMDAAELAMKLGGLQAEDDQDKEDADVVTMATAHSCKGLEWSVVFVVDPLDDVWPSKTATRGLKTKTKEILEDIADEEKRLLYVAVTRAKQNLILVCPMTSWSQSQRRREASEFFSDDIRTSINGVLNGQEAGPAKFHRIL